MVVAAFDTESEFLACMDSVREELKAAGTAVSLSIPTSTRRELSSNPGITAAPPELGRRDARAGGYAG